MLTILTSITAFASLAVLALLLGMRGKLGKGGDAVTAAELQSLKEKVGVKRASYGTSSPETEKKPPSSPRLSGKNCGTASQPLKSAWMTTPKRNKTCCASSLTIC